MLGSFKQDIKLFFLVLGAAFILSGCGFNSGDRPDTGFKMQTSQAQSQNRYLGNSLNTTSAEENGTSLGLNYYSAEQVSAHNSKDDCWIIINREVIDATGYINRHPGGPAAIINSCGKDATEAFNEKEKHQSQKTNEKMKTLVIGQIK